MDPNLDNFDMPYLCTNVLHSLLRNAPIPLFYKNKQGTYLGGNQLWLNMFGFQKSEAIIGKSVYDIAPKEVADKWKAQDELVFSLKENPQIYEMSIPDSKKNQMIDVIFYKSAYFNENGEVDGLIGAVLDVTKERAYKQQLQTSQHQLTLLLDNLPSAVILSKNGYFTYVNKAFKSMMNVANDFEFLNKQVTDFLSPEHHGIFNIRKNTNYHKTHTKSVDYKLTRPDGSTVWVEVNSSLVHYDGEETIASVMTNNDERKNHELMLQRFNTLLTQTVETEVQKRLKAEEERLESEKKLIAQSKMATMGNMLGAITHQLNQPLTSLPMIVELIAKEFEQGTLTQEALQEYQADVYELTTYMSTTIELFKNYYRHSEDKELCFVADTINDVIRIMDKKFYIAGIKIITDFDPTLIYFGYSNDLMQVLINLLSNSYDALIERDIQHPFISLRAFGNSDTITLEIADNAGGIDSVLLPQKIFEAYTTTKGLMGMGVGLQICKMLCERNLNGTIAAHNTHDGALFTITLPSGGQSHLKTLK